MGRRPEREVHATAEGETQCLPCTSKGETNLHNLLMSRRTHAQIEPWLSGAAFLTQT